MKIKHIILMLMIFFLCGCTKVTDLSINDVINRFSDEIKVSDIYHKGYKYYLPEGMQISKYMDYNDIIDDNNYEYYLYVDLISYYNKTENKYEKNTVSYYSDIINSNDKIGHIEINKMENTQYLIEIMYNYAKIEVMVDENDIQSSLMKAVSILKSIKYNDNIINKLIGNEQFTSEEEVYNIFNTTSKDSNYLNFVEEDEIEELETEEEIPDSDLIN